MTTTVNAPGWRRAYGAPLCIGLNSILGFVAAFIFGEIGQWLCWFGLGLPIVLIAWTVIRRLT